MRVLPFAVVLLAAGAARAEEPTGVVPLTVHPAALPEPALRYRLMPPREGLKPGNARVGYSRAWVAAQEKIRPTPLKFIQRYERLESAPMDKYPREEVRAFLNEHADVLSELDAAARRAECDWQIDDRARVENLGPVLAEIQQTRELTRLNAMRIRLALVERRYDDAVHALQTGFAIAKHTADGPSLIHGLVGVAVAHINLGLVEDLIRLPDSPNMYWALATLPHPLVDLRQLIESEMNWQEHLSPEFENLEKTPLSEAEAERVFARYVRRRAKLQQELEPEPAKVITPDEYLEKYAGEARESLRKSGFDADLLAKMPDAQALLIHVFRATERGNQRVIRWFYFPTRVALERLESQEETPASESETLGGLVGSIGASWASGTKVLFAVLRVERQMDALRAVEAVRLHAARHEGRYPKSWADITGAPVPKDPATGQPFGLKLSDGKLRISSPPLWKGVKPTHWSALIYELKLASE